MKRRDFLGCAAMGTFGIGKALAVTASPDFDPFDNATIHEIRIESEGWETLRANYLSNTWYPCRFSFDASDVVASIRSRGNGSRDGNKPGLKISFKRTPDSGPFGGLDSLVLGNGKQDGTLLKNALSFGLYRKIGVPAPRLSYARITVNGQYWGLYTVTEDVEPAFLRDRFGSADGFLYEYSWADEYHFEDRGVEEPNYTPSPFDLKTNPKATNTIGIAALIGAINRAPDGSFSASVGQHLDLTELARFLAVEVLLDDRDSLLGDWGMNNFYLYRLPQEPRFRLIAWDKDWSFFDWRQPLLTSATQNILVRRLLVRPAWREIFRDELNRACRIAEEWLEAEIRSRGALIYSTSQSDPMRLTGMGRIEDDLPRLIEFAQRRVPFVRENLVRL